MVKKVSTHKEFLERLEKFGIDNGYFEKQLIGKINKTCCSNSNTEVIDFDKTKDVVTKICQLNPPKSCDALKIIPNKNRLDFIEFKGFKNFIANNSNNFQISLRKQVEKFDFPKKIKDSLLILDNIVFNKLFKATNPEKDYYENTEKNYIILVDIDLQNNPVEGLALTFATLAQTSSKPEVLIAQELSNSVNTISGSSLHNLKSPILKSCHNIDSFY